MTRKILKELVLWSLYTILGFVLGTFLSLYIVDLHLFKFESVDYKCGIITDCLRLPNFDFSLQEIFFYDLLFNGIIAICIGLFQYFQIRKKGIKLLTWISCTFIGYLLPFLAIDIYQYWQINRINNYVSVFHKYPEEMIYSRILFVIIIVCIFCSLAIFQSIAIKISMGKWFLWPYFTMIGIILSKAITTPLLFYFEYDWPGKIMLIWLLDRLNSPLFHVFEYKLGKWGYDEIINAFISGIFIGIFSGIALIRIAQKQKCTKISTYRIVVILSAILIIICAGVWFSLHKIWLYERRQVEEQKRKNEELWKVQGQDVIKRLTDKMMQASMGEAKLRHPSSIIKNCSEESHPTINIYSNSNATITVNSNPMSNVMYKCHMVGGVDGVHSFDVGIKVMYRIALSNNEYFSTIYGAHIEYDNPQ